MDNLWTTEYFSNAFSALIAANPLLDGIALSGLFGKVIVFILLVSSLVVWYVMIDKFLKLRRARSETRHFLMSFRKEAHPVSLWLKNRQMAGSPLIKVYNNCCRAVGRELNPHARDVSELFTEGVDYELSPRQIDVIRKTADRNIADEALNLESGMNLLSTATAAAPFLGLLGTVWGVMVAFTAAAAQGSADLTALAPGVAAALVTTVVGLVVAIPSMIGYNFIANSIRTHCVQMDNFATELVESFQRTM